MAAAIANNTEFGLTAYVYAGNMACMMRMTDRDAGMLGINRWGLESAARSAATNSGFKREGEWKDQRISLDP
ncbi:hypothetical protein ARTHRO9V_280039 [Arthrobacter sp. 9V]|nr:hypothetical protein ARTHRO9V_280039 [Arthrobacter sp. 9V]